MRNLYVDFNTPHIQSKNNRRHSPREFIPVRTYQSIHLLVSNPTETVASMSANISVECSVNISQGLPDVGIILDDRNYFRWCNDIPSSLNPLYVHGVGMKLNY